MKYNSGKLRLTDFTPIYGYISYKKRNKIYPFGKVRHWSFIMNNGLRTFLIELFNVFFFLFIIWTVSTLFN